MLTDIRLPVSVNKPRALISFENHDLVAVLICHQQEITGRIEIEIPWCLTHRGLMTYRV